ncbi:MAG: hypothetical protein H0Z32_08435 [Bacillaceae bacterium]|nr:hypothetical protein [Bacillaceae bacterium]
MIILPIIVAVSLILYIYFKVKILTLKDPTSMHYTNAKAKIALGSFVFFFGIYQYFIFDGAFSLAVGLIFLFIGGLQGYYGAKLLKHFKQELSSEKG